MPNYFVTWDEEIIAVDAEAAAVEALRVLQTTRPQEFVVKEDRGKSVHVVVRHGAAKRI